MSHPEKQPEIVYVVDTILDTTPLRKTHFDLDSGEGVVALLPDRPVIFSRERSLGAQASFGAFINYLQFYEGQGHEPPVFRQEDARSEVAEAQRDFLVHLLSRAWEEDVDGRLNKAENRWKAKHQGLITPRPHMIKALGIEDPGEGVKIPGVVREYHLGYKAGKTRWIHEVEIPDGDKWTRAIYLESKPRVVAAKPEESKQVA